MADVTVASIDETEPIYDGLARRARATLGVTSWGMQVFTLPPNWDGYPQHKHDAAAFDPNQEEVYIPIEGSATLLAGDASFELRPGTMVRVGPAQLRQILPAQTGSASSHSAGFRGASLPRSGPSSVRRLRRRRNFRS